MLDLKHSSQIVSPNRSPLSDVGRYFMAEAVSFSASAGADHDKTDGTGVT